MATSYQPCLGLLSDTEMSYLARYSRSGRGSWDHGDGLLCRWCSNEFRSSCSFIGSGCRRPMPCARSKASVTAELKDKNISRPQLKYGLETRLLNVLTRRKRVSELSLRVAVRIHIFVHSFLRAESSLGSRTRDFVRRPWKSSPTYTAITTSRKPTSATSNVRSPDIDTIRLRFDGRLIAYQRSLRSHPLAEVTQINLFIYIIYLDHSVGAYNSLRSKSRLSNYYYYYY